jgi:hypothetical protein
MNRCILFYTFALFAVTSCDNRSSNTQVTPETSTTSLKRANERQLASDEPRKDRVISGQIKSVKETRLARKQRQIDKEIKKIEQLVARHKRERARQQVFIKLSDLSISATSDIASKQFQEDRKSATVQKLETTQSQYTIERYSLWKLQAQKMKAQQDAAANP